MPRKSAAARKRVLLPGPPASYGGALPVSKVAMSGRAEEDDLALAIRNSKALSLQTETYEASLAMALALSKGDAEQEAADSEALRLAIAASEAEEKQKRLGLALASETSACSRSESAACSSRWSRGRGTSYSEDISEVIAEAAALPFGNAEKIAMAAAPSNHTVAPDAFAEAVPDASVSRLLKVTYEQDTRRLLTQWCSGARPRDIVASIRTAIEESYGLPLGSAVPPAYFLKYRDDEGDLCTLVEETLTDFLEMALQGTSLKITLEKGQDKCLQITEPETLEDCDGSCDVQTMQAKEPKILEEKGLQNKELEQLEHCKCSRDVQSMQTNDLELLEDFSIATPPGTPRCESPAASSGTIEEDYDSMWSLVEVEPAEPFKMTKLSEMHLS